MKYYSTRNKKEVSLKDAVLKGLADDGGLYMPEKITPFPPTFFEQITQKNLQEISLEIAKQFISETDIPTSDLKKIVDDAINFEIPLVQLEENMYSLELFHGPTMAFKDVGARFMARLMSYFSQGKKLKVIAATSGDTGSAVAAGFYQVPGIEVYILYPKGKVSPLQEKQLTTWGENITAIEVEGTFDDCQMLAKALLSDEKFNKENNLTSANSINIARLIPQSFYYFWAYRNLKDLGKPIAFSVPSGNYGNLTAGLFAKKMGLPVEKFIASTNVNSIVPDYLATGNYLPKPSIQTISNAMDVGNPSNFERMTSLFENDLENFKSNIEGKFYSDEATSITIKEVYHNLNYMLDPHGAVAYLGLKDYLTTHENSVGVFLESAHPAKFLEIVEPILQEKIEIPERLEAFNKKEKKSILTSVNVENIKKIIAD